MSLDARTSKLTKKGAVVLVPDPRGGTRVAVHGFDAEGCTCRDLSVLAMLWAIGELQQHVMRSIERPGNEAVVMECDFDQDEADGA